MYVRPVVGVLISNASPQHLALLINYAPTQHDLTSLFRLPNSIIPQGLTRLFLGRATQRSG